MNLLQENVFRGILNRRLNKTTTVHGLRFNIELERVNCPKHLLPSVFLRHNQPHNVNVKLVAFHVVLASTLVKLLLELLCVEWRSVLRVNGQTVVAGLFDFPLDRVAARLLRLEVRQLPFELPLDNAAVCDCYHQLAFLDAVCVFTIEKC